MKSSSVYSNYLGLIALVAVGVSFVAVIFAITLQAGNSTGNNSNIANATNPFGSTNDLKKFSSYTEMASFLSKVQAFFATLQDRNDANDSSTLGPAYDGTTGGSYGSGGLAGTFDRLIPFSGNEANPSMMSKQATTPSYTQSGAAITENNGDSNYYSGTNVQVAGVDEADFLKNDDKYMYLLSGTKLTIADAYPPESAKVLSRVSLDIPNGQNLQDMFVNANKLIIFYQDYSYSSGKGISDNFSSSTVGGDSLYPYPGPISEPTTHILIIDITDRTSPKLVKNYEITGQYSSSRMIGNQVFLLTISSIYSDQPTRPSVYDSSSIVILNPDVYYFDYPQQYYSFNTVTALDLAKISTVVDSNNADSKADPKLGLASKTFMIGSGSTIYVSDKNIYIAYSENPWPIPLAYQQSQSNPGIVQYHDFIASTSIQKTAIHKISIQSGSLFEYVGKAEVPGTLLNQFSMDEHGDRFTVATTSESQSAPYRGFNIQNNVYRLDGKMGIVGKLEGIADGESIYAARFMGDKLYLVTFRQTDPFFVIDLSQDQPEILGKLKLPGYSNYLHPYDSTHIMGFGREGPESGNEQGVKLALFDVSDLNNPKAVDTYVIGSYQTDSEVLRDHKALLFSKEKDLLSIPINSYDGYYSYNSDGGSTDREVDPLSKVSGPWNGFYVFGVNPENGFNLKGTIQHNGVSSDYMGIDMSQGSRSFFIKDALYTVTAGGFVKISELEDVGRVINQVKLNGTGEIVKPLSD